MSAQGRIRVFSVDDHPLLHEGIAAIINHQPDMQLVAQASSGSEAIRQFREHRPRRDSDGSAGFPDMSGIDAMIAIRTEFPEARIIMLTTFEGDMDIQRALEAGACGYLLKSMPAGDLVAGIRQVHGGKKRIPPEVAARLAEHLGDEDLTQREVDVLRLVAAPGTGIGISLNGSLSRRRPSKFTSSTLWRSWAPVIALRPLPLLYAGA